MPCACYMHVMCMLFACYVHAACGIACTLHDYNMQATCMVHACDTPNKVGKTCM